MRTRSISPHANVDKAQTTPTPGPSRYAVPAQPLQELGLVALKPSEPTSSEVPKMQSAPMPSIVPSSPGTALEVPTGASVDQTVAKPVIVPSSVSLAQAAPTTTTGPNGVAVVQATAVPAMAQRQMLTIQVPSAVTMAEVRPTTLVNMRTRSISPHANVDKAQTTPTPGPSRYAVPAQPLQELGLVALKPSEPPSSEVPKVQSAPMPSIVPSSPGTALEVPTGASIDQTIAKPVIVPSSVSLVQAAPTTTTVPNGVAVVQATAVPAMEQRQMLTTQVPSAVTMAEVRPTTPVDMRTRSISPHANVDKAQTTPTRREAASQPGPSRYAGHHMFNV